MFVPMGVLDSWTSSRASGALGPWSDTPHTVSTIRDWAGRDGYDAVIWTTLASNFREREKTDLSVHAALTYLGTLDKLNLPGHSTTSGTRHRKSKRRFAMR